MAEIERDYFSDPGVIETPHDYFDAARGAGPVWREPHHGTLMVTGYREAVDVLTRGSTVFSSAVSVVGPIPPLPFDPQDGDLLAALDRHRADLPWAAHLTSFDGKKHGEQRTLLTALMTHKRLKANEAYLRGLANSVIDRFIDAGRCNAATDYAHAVATYAISDLMGIPEEDRAILVDLLGVPPSQIDGDATHRVGPDPLIFLKERFDGYLRARRENPIADLMSELVNSRYKDGREPDFDDVSNLARFMFGAGQDTTSRLVTTTIRVLGDEPELQRRIRADPSRIANLLEEVLRWDGPVKTVYRLAMEQTTVGEVEVAPGTIICVALMAANNDPAHFDNPRTFDPDRPRLRDHVAFSRGAHGCLGAPLARLEARVAIEELLARTSDIRIAEAEHGPRSARRYRYEPTYAFRSMSDLHIEMTPAAGGAVEGPAQPLAAA